MKISLFIVFALLLNGSTWAQSPPKRANTIIVTLPDSGSTTWKRVVRAVLAKGFVLKSNSEEFLSFNSELRSLTPGIQASISGFIQGSNLALSGMYLVPDLDPSPSPIVFRGMKGSPFMVSWYMMDEFAHSLSGQIRYEVR